MKIHEYNEMMAYLTRPAVNRTGFNQDTKKVQTASLMDEYLGDQKEYQRAVDEGFQGTYEEFLQWKSMRETSAQGGVIGKGGMFQGEDLGNRTGFRKISANQYGEFKTKNKIGAPITGETISKSEFNKIYKFLKDRPGIGIYKTQRDGAYTIKVKVEKAGKFITEPDILYSKDNLKMMLEKWQSARDKLFPNQITDAKFKELRLLNENLTDAQFADLLNESNYLTTKGNKFTSTSAFNFKKRLGLGTLGPREFRTIGEAEKILKEKFGKNFKQIFKTNKEIFAKATQIVNDLDKYKGTFPRGAGAEGFLWEAFNRAAKANSEQISYDLSALDYELPMENGKVNWRKKINKTPAWKLVKFIDNDVGKTFSWNDKTGSLKNQVNTAYNNTNKFNNAVKGFYEQAGISEEFGNEVRDNFILKDLEARLERKITKADDELVNKWLKDKRPGFSLTEVHHPEGVEVNVYNTQNVVRAANLKENDLNRIRQKEIKTIGEAAAQKNYNEALQAVSDEFGGIQKKVGSRYVGDAPTIETITKTLINNGASKDAATKVSEAIQSMTNKANSGLNPIDIAKWAKAELEVVKEAGLKYGGKLFRGLGYIDSPLMQVMFATNVTDFAKDSPLWTTLPMAFTDEFAKYAGLYNRAGGKISNFLKLTASAGVPVNIAKKLFPYISKVGKFGSTTALPYLKVAQESYNTYKQLQDAKKYGRQFGLSEEEAVEALKKKWRNERPMIDDYMDETEMSEIGKQNLASLKRGTQKLGSFFGLADDPYAYNKPNIPGTPIVASETMDDYLNRKYKADDQGYAVKINKDEEEFFNQGGRVGFGQGTDDPDKRILILDTEFDDLSLEEKLLIEKLAEKGELKYNQGGRVNFDKGSKPKSPGRRTFLKGITYLAALPLVGRYFKLGKVLERASTYTGPAIEKVKGMPEWFPGLVKKLFNEGEDVTKQVATKERQVVKRGELEGGDEVDMIYDLDTGNVSIEVTPKKGEFSTKSGAYEKSYGLDYKKGIGDETTKGTPPDEFGAIEARPYQVGKNEVELDFDDVDIDDAISDLTELENFAKKKK